MLFEKKMIFVLPSLELGGAERQALLLARFLIQEHHAKVEIWGFTRPGRTSELCEAYGIPWKLVPWPWSRGSIKGSSRLTRGWSYINKWAQRKIGLLRYTIALKEAEPDILLPYTMFPNMICGLSWKKGGAKLCIWNQRDEGRGRMGSKWERKVIPAVPLFISNSQHGADFLVNALHAEPKKVHIINNGIALPEPQCNRTEWRKQLHLSENAFVACMVANLTRFKDHATLLCAWRQVVNQLQKDKHQAILLLAGRKDENFESLKDLTKELNLEGNVLFLEGVEDISGLLNAVDLGIHSSYLEGLPNSILEMMATGLAVVATDIPGNREALGDGGFEFLVEPKNPIELAEKILLLANNPDLRQLEGARNRRRIKEEFSPEKMCEATVNLISQSLAAGRQREI